MSVDTRARKLEAAILADRSKDQAWLVYADHLLEQGDPRGELAELQAKTGHSKLSRAAQKLLWDRREDFFGPLAPMLAPFSHDDARAVTATWRHGFMDCLKLSGADAWSSTRTLEKGKKPLVLLCTLGHPLLAPTFAAQKLPDRFKAMPAYVHDSRLDKRNKLFDRIPEAKLPSALERAAHKVTDELDEAALEVLPIKEGEAVRGGFHSSASLEDVKASFETDGFQVVLLDEVYSSVAGVESAAELVALLPQVASARLLRELVVGDSGVGADGSYNSLIKALVKVAPSLQSIQRLSVGDFGLDDYEMSWSSVGDVGPLCKAFPRLEALTLHSGKLKLAPIAHARLESLELITGGLSRQSLESISRSRLPRLRTLSIWTGEKPYGGTCRVQDLAAFLESPVLANVKHLGLKNCEFGDELVALLAQSKVLPRLESLDLSRGHLTEATVDTITAHAKAFAKLKKLDVSEGLLPRSSRKKLIAVVKGLVFGQQSPEWMDADVGEDDRYESVSE